MLMPLVSSSVSAVRLAIELLEDRAGLERRLCVVQRDASLTLVRRYHQHDATLAGHEIVLAEASDVDGERRHCPGLAAASADDGVQFLDALQRLVRGLSVG